MSRGSSQVPPLSGVKPRAGERLPQAGVSRDDAEVRGEREVQAEARRPTAHRAHDRDLGAEQQRHQTVRLRREASLDAAHARLALSRSVVRCPRVTGDEVEAGAEVVAGGIDEDRPDALVPVGALEVSIERLHGRVVEGVALVGPVERDPQDPVSHPGVQAVDRWVRDRCFGHRLQPSCA